MNRKLSYEDLLDKVEELEERLARSERSRLFLERLVNAVRDSLFVKNSESRWIFLNDAACRLIGHSRAELLGKKPHDFYPEKQAEVFREKDESILETGLPVVSEDEISLPDGKIHVISTSKSLFMDPETGEKFVAGIIRDMTDYREIEQRLQLALDVSGISVWEWDVQNDRVTRIGKNREPLFGLTPEGYEDTCKGFFSLVHPTDLPLVRKTLQDLLTSGGTRHTEYRIIGADGQTYWFSTIVVAERNRDGEVFRIVGATQNITGQKRAAEDLRRSEERYRRMFESLQEGIWEIDRDSFTRFANPAMAKILGYTQDEMKGRHLFEFMDEKCVELCMENLERRRSGIREQHDFEFINKNGKRVFTIIKTAPLLDEQGNYDGAVASITDITERRRMEEALRESETRYRTIFDTTHDGIFIIDMDGRLFDVNLPGCRMTGYSREDIIGKSCHELLHPDSFQTFGEFQKTALAGLFFHGEGKGIRQDGSMTDLEIYGSRIEIHGEIYLFACLRDVSVRKRERMEREQLEARLRRRQKLEAIGTLTGGLAHEFNNIMAIIIGNAELAADHVPVHTPLHLHLEQILEAAQRAGDVVRRLLDFNRNGIPKHRQIRIGPLLMDILSLIRASVPSSVTLVPDIRTQSDSIMGDPGQIHQLVVNLCTNAAWAMNEKGGILKISLDNSILESAETGSHYPCMKPGRYLRLTVEDTGCGIAPEIMERIFDPYFSTRPAGEGTGMGLTMVHGIVRNHGGGISVCSTLKKGTRFSIIFPAENGNAEGGFSEPAICSGGDERILLVDDEKAITDMLACTLRRSGYRVESRTDPLDALELFRTAPLEFDLVISDMTMPGMTGDLLAAEILKIRSDIPVILCTGYSRRMDPETALKAGIRKLVEKPVNRKALVQTIREVLGRRPVPS